MRREEDDGEGTYLRQRPESTSQARLGAVRVACRQRPLETVGMASLCRGASSPAFPLQGREHFPTLTFAGQRRWVVRTGETATKEEEEERGNPES